MLQYLSHHGAYELEVKRICDLMRIQIDAQLSKHVANQLIEAADRILDAPGDLFRPILLLEACRAVGGNPELCYPAAAAIGLLEIGATVHADALRTEPYRHGVPTMQHLYGPQLATPGGAMFYCAAYSAIASGRTGLPPDRVFRAIATISAALADYNIGLALEEQTMRGCISARENCLEVARLKSGSLIYAALRCGAILGGGTPDQVTALHRCGEQLGIAYQMATDLLTYTAIDDETGKARTTDLRNQIVSVPILNALTEADAADQQELLALFTGPRPQEVDSSWRRVRGILTRSGAARRTQANINSYMHQSQYELESLPDNLGHSRLHDLIELAIHHPT